MKLLGGMALAIVAACGGEEPLPEPLAEIEGTIGKLAVNDTSIFAINTTDGTLLELGLDGSLIGTVPSIGEVIDVAARGDFVAWVEVEGTGTVVKRRTGDLIESQRTFDAGVLATDEGIFYSDIGIVAVWEAAVPERIATPGPKPELLDVDLTFAYVREEDTSIVLYNRAEMTSEIAEETTTAAAVRDGELAYRTAEGIRKRDLAGEFDRLVGAIPESYECPLLMAGKAVLCGKFRAFEGTVDELLRDPVAGYTAVDTEVYWVRTEGAISAIRVIDADK